MMLLWLQLIAGLATALVLGAGVVGQVLSLHILKPKPSIYAWTRLTGRIGTCCFGAAAALGAASALHLWGIPTLPPLRIVTIIALTIITVSQVVNYVMHPQHLKGL